MPWYAVVMIAVYAMSAGVTLALVDKERKPITSTAALLSLVLNGLLIWGVVALAAH